MTHSHVGQYLLSQTNLFLVGHWEVKQGPGRPLLASPKELGLLRETDRYHLDCSFIILHFLSCFLSFCCLLLLFSYFVHRISILTSKVLLHKHASPKFVLSTQSTSLFLFSKSFLYFSYFVCHIITECRLKRTYQKIKLPCLTVFTSTNQNLLHGEKKYYVISTGHTNMTRKLIQ